VTVALSLIFAMLLSALGGALALATMAERQMAGSHDRGVEALYAADGAAERAMQDLPGIADWTAVVNGAARSSFVDGAPGGARMLPDGTALDLTTLTNELRCGRATGCTDAQMNAATAERPWGTNNPRWQLFAYGPLDSLLPDGVRSPFYVIVWVADDAAEGDGRPLVDGDPNTDGSTNTGRDVVTLLAHAYGVAGSRRMVEVTVARAAAGIRILAWREVRS
jgi:hypothetical protein